MTAYYDLPGLRQEHIDWLLRSGVSIDAMIHPEAIRLAHGHAERGLLVRDPAGDPWLAFAEESNVAYWQPRSGELALEVRGTFALGEGVIGLPETYSFDCYLNVFGSPLDWLRAGRDGIVVIDWSLTWERLHGVPRVALAESVVFPFRRHFKPPTGPEVAVMRERRAAA